MPCLWHHLAAKHHAAGHLQRITKTSFWGGLTALNLEGYCLLYALETGYQSADVLGLANCFFLPDVLVRGGSKPLQKPLRQVA